LTTARAELAGSGNATYGVFGGGHTSTQIDTIDFITIDSTGDAEDFGDLTSALSFLSSAGGINLCLFAGGYTGTGDVCSNVIQKVSFDSTGDASDFGDLTLGRQQHGGLSSYVPS